MAITFRTWDPPQLLASFRQQIASGHVRTWKEDTARDFYHDTHQWRGDAYFRPVTTPDTLVLYLKFYLSMTSDKRSCYSELHGAMAYSFLQHCHPLFRDLIIGADPTGEDHALV